MPNRRLLMKKKVISKERKKLQTGRNETKSQNNYEINIQGESQTNKENKHSKEGDSDNFS